MFFLFGFRHLPYTETFQIAVSCFVWNNDILYTYDDLLEVYVLYMFDSNEENLPCFRFSWHHDICLFISFSTLMTPLRTTSYGCSDCSEFFFFAAVQIPTRVRGCVSVSLWMNSLDYSSFIVCSFLHSFLVFLSGSTFHLFDEMLYLCQVLKYTCNSFLSFHTSRLLIYFHWLSKKILQFSLFFSLPTSKQVF